MSEPRKTCVADALSLCGSWASCFLTFGVVLAISCGVVVQWLRRRTCNADCRLRVRQQDVLLPGINSGQVVQTCAASLTKHTGTNCIESRWSGYGSEELENWGIGLCKINAFWAISGCFLFWKVMFSKQHFVQHAIIQLSAWCYVHTAGDWFIFSFTPDLIWISNVNTEQRAISLQQLSWAAVFALVESWDWINWRTKKA